MFDYYKLYEVAKKISENHSDVPYWILYGILILGLLIIGFGLFMFYFYSEPPKETIGSFLLCLGIIICFIFGIIRNDVRKVKKNKKEFETMIKEENIKTTPEKIISEANKLKAFCSYYYSKNDDFCASGMISDEINKKTFNIIFKRIYENETAENEDKVEKAFEYITK